MISLNTKEHFNELTDKAEQARCRVLFIGGCPDFNYKGHTCYTKVCYHIDDYSITLVYSDLTDEIVWLKVIRPDFSYFINDYGDFVDPDDDEQIYDLDIIFSEIINGEPKITKII